MSSKKNQKIKRKLKSMYGNGCFFDRAHIAERIEAMGGIKTFKVFVEERRFKGKAISYQLTVHHLRHRSEGGETTVENCANIAEIAHQYTHSLDREDEEIVNNMLREFKVNFIMMQGDGKVLDSGSIEPEPAQEYIVIPVYNNTPEQEAERKKRLKAKRLKNPSRAMKKQELRKIIEEEENEIDF